MSIRRFIAPTARQALRDIRNELGDDAMILSNRKMDGGVEIVALANGEIDRLAGQGSIASDLASVVCPPGQMAMGSARSEDWGSRIKGQGSIIEGRKPSVSSSASVEKGFAPGQASRSSEHVLKPSSPQASESSILGEIKLMHSMLQQQFAVLSWNDVQQRDPQRAALLRRMLNSGFSAMLARQLLDKLPGDKAQGEAWIKQVLRNNLRVAGETNDIVVKGGVYALIGPTGVGKTTTTAKLAARAVVRYGADKVALLTTDSYRIGAYEQLRIYGKILGVAVHAVKDTDDLRLTLSALRHKHLVLIDTVGMGQRDERVGDQKEMLDATGVQRLLLLNATSGGDTLEEVVRMYHSEKVIGCIPTKLDEAVSLGTILDVVLRHRLILHYIANGQRVPEDLHSVNTDYLLHRALKPIDKKTPFTLHKLEFSAVMAADMPADVIFAGTGSAGEMTRAL